MSILDCVTLMDFDVYVVESVSVMIWRVIRSLPVLL